MADNQSPIRYDPQGLDIPEIPKSLLGPTGRVFLRPDGKGYSTVIGTVQDATDGGGYVIAPLLVQGQENIAGLLEGQKATKAQLLKALQAAMQGPGPEYPTVDTALAAESGAHDTNAAALLPYILPYLLSMQPESQSK